MTWVDLAVLGVLAMSALLAFSRGFAREVLSLAAWVGAIFIAVWALPRVRPQFSAWFGTPAWVDPVAFAAVFIICLIVLMIISRSLGALVRGSVIGGLDRTLGHGIRPGAGCGAVMLAYIIAGMVVPVDRWPDVVLNARSLPLVYQGARWAVERLPSDHRPQLYAPPAGRATTADAIFQAAPAGKAAGKQ